MVIYNRVWLIKGLLSQGYISKDCMGKRKPEDLEIKLLILIECLKKCHIEELDGRLDRLILFTEV